MKSYKNNLKALWAICPIVLMLLIPFVQTQGYELFFLRNTEFASDLGGWFTAIENPWPYQTVTPGTIEWSSVNGGSAHMIVSGAPSVVGLISFLGTTIFPGDTIICRATTGNMTYATLSLELGARWQGFGQYVSIVEQSNITQDMILIANRLYDPGTAILIHLGSWPGSGEAWIQYIQLKRADGSTTSVHENQHTFNAIPSHIAELYHPTPNPASKNVQIAYAIEQKEPVTLRIFNVNGRLVRAFEEKNVRPGNHSIIWDCTDNNGKTVPADVYFYELNVNGKTFTKKSVIVR